MYQAVTDVAQNSPKTGEICGYIKL